MNPALTNRRLGAWLFLLPFCLAPLRGLAGDPPAWNVHLQFTSVVVPAADSLALIEAFDDETKAGAAWEKLLAAVKAGQAEITAQLAARTFSGVKVDAATTTELRYPTTYDPPAFPAVEFPRQVAALPKGVASVSLVPDTFETRHLGASMEATPLVTPNGQRITLTLIASESRFLGWQPFEVGVTPQGAKITYEQPRFSSADSAGCFALASGERHLFGTHALEGKPARTALFFIKAWTTPAAPDAAKKPEEKKEK